MTEAAFLERYDPAEFPRPSVTVDLVLMTVREGRLAVLLQQRRDHPFKDQWALPGGFVGIEESLDQAAERVLSDKVGLAPAGWLEQLYTFGAPDRDPRMRIITVAYFALRPLDVLDGALAARSDLALASLDIRGAKGATACVSAQGIDAAALPLAFDHAQIIATAVDRLRGMLDYAPVAIALLPALFTLRALQDVHEAILGKPLNKPAFRRRMLDRGWIEGTGAREQGTSYRPAELYRLRHDPNDGT